MSILSFAYAGYSRKVSCALNLIYTIVLLNIPEYTYTIMEAQKIKRIPLFIDIFSFKVYCIDNALHVRLRYCMSWFETRSG